MYYARIQKEPFSTGWNLRGCADCEAVSLLVIYKLKCVLVDSYGDSFLFISFPFVRFSLFQRVSVVPGIIRFGVSLLRFSAVCYLSCRAQCDLLRNHVHCTVYFVRTALTDVNALAMRSVCTFSIVRASRIRVLCTPLGRERNYLFSLSHRCSYSLSQRTWKYKWNW